MSIDNPLLQRGGTASNNQATLHKYFKRYQPPSDFDPVNLLRASALQEAERRRSSNPTDSREDNHSKSDGCGSNEPPLGSIMSNGEAGHRPLPPQDESSAPDSAYLTPLLKSNSLRDSDPADSAYQSDLKRKHILRSGSIDDQTLRPTKRSRSTSAEPHPGPPPPSSSTNLSAPPATPQISASPSSKPLTFGLSQDNPVYVPSSQSDENYDIEGDETVLAGEVSENKHEALSDSDSSSSSSSSLESLNDILEKHQPKPLSWTRSRAYMTRSDGRRTLPSAFDQRPKVNEKYSLGNLLKQHNRDVSAQAEVSRAELELQDRPEEPDKHLEVDKSLLASLVKQEDGEDEVDKLLHAMDRAEVMNTEIAWHFFDVAKGQPSFPKVPSFPRLADDLSTYQCLFNDRVSRDSAFLTGFSQDILSSLSLPDEMRQWLWQAAASESREDLAAAYMAVLRSAKLINLLGTDHIAWLFQSLNTKQGSMNTTDDIKPMPKNVNASPREHPQQLPRVLQMLTNLSCCLSTDANVYALEILLRLAIDSEITKHIEVRQYLERSLNSLIMNLPEDAADTTLASASTKLLNNLAHPILQHRLLSSIPSTMPRVHQFKRRLALSFFLSSPNPLQLDFNDASAETHLSEDIISRLKTDPALQISDSSTNYRELAALISILDIGIDGGFHVAATPVEAADENTTPFPPEALDAPTRKAAEKAHNAAVDAISKQVHILFSRIVDSGASHMARTEAKAVLERLIYRLDYAVRTVPRARKGVWSAVRPVDWYFRTKGEEAEDVMVEEKADAGGGAVEGVTTER